MSAANKTSSSSQSEKIDKEKAEKLAANKEWLAMSKKERFQIILKDYGKTTVVFHTAISLLSLGIIYTLVSSGIDFTPFFDYFENDDKAESEETLSKKILSGSSTFVVAYAIHKFMAPLRITTTLGCTPIIVRYLRRNGILKPPQRNKTS